jgi:hypothetical protein
MEQMCPLHPAVRLRCPACAGKKGGSVSTPRKARSSRRNMKLAREAIRSRGGGPRGIRTPARDGDKTQARHSINFLVRNGTIPRPATLPCADCAHIGSGPRHEYDHFLGYAAEHHRDVQAVCSQCHAKREAVRKTLD